jgi:hypothetical protein
MSDLGDIFNMFSDEGNSRPRKQTASQDEPADIDPKSVIMNKLARNKPLLIATVVTLYQERKTDRTLEALRDLLTRRAINV